MEIIRSTAKLQHAMQSARAEGKTIGLVPTMGALHDGHISLVERARHENDVVIVSVFVNPTQFNNAEDLRTYPRTEQADCDKLRNAAVDYVFMPTVEEIYPEKDTRVFDLGEVAEVMEGPMRPGHFNGVAQIVSKLFEYTHATRAYFGEKDFQQIAVIRRMKEITGSEVEIVPCPILRHLDGLAMSSRNVRLSPEQRQVAPGIYKVLKESVDYALSHTVAQTKQYVTDKINALPYMKVEYYEIVDPVTMQPVDTWQQCSPHGSAQGCVTVYCGDVRLIDNIKYSK